jgi:hypothetical protein
MLAKAQSSHHDLQRYKILFRFLICCLCHATGNAKSASQKVVRVLPFSWRLIELHLLL